MEKGEFTVSQRVLHRMHFFSFLKDHPAYGQEPNSRQKAHGFLRYLPHHNGCSVQVGEAFKS